MNKTEHKEKLHFFAYDSEKGVAVGVTQLSDNQLGRFYEYRVEALVGDKKVRHTDKKFIND